MRADDAATATSTEAADEPAAKATPSGGVRRRRQVDPTRLRGPLLVVCPSALVHQRQLTFCVLHGTRLLFPFAFPGCVCVCVCARARVCACVCVKAE